MTVAWCFQASSVQRGLPILNAGLHSATNMQSWRQSQLQVEEPKSAIKHGGPGKKFISTREFTSKSMLLQSWRQSQLQVEEPKSAIKHRGPGKTFISIWEFT